MSITYVVRAFGSTLILNTTPPPAPTPSSEAILVQAFARDGVARATARDGRARAYARDGVVRATARDGRVQANTRDGIAAGRGH